MKEISFFLWNYKRNTDFEGNDFFLSGQAKFHISLLGELALCSRKVNPPEYSPYPSIKIEIEATISGMGVIAWTPSIASGRQAARWWNHTRDPSHTNETRSHVYGQACIAHGTGTEIRYQDPSALPWSKMATATTGKDVYTAIIPRQWWLDLV